MTDPERIAELFGVPVRFLPPSLTVPSEIRTDSLAVSGAWVSPRWWSADPNPFPEFTFWPAIDRAEAFATLARERVTDAVHVLRHGLPEEDW
ncbi:MAG TPA: hypothetical protein VGE43_04535 [Acidimicrobiales bacterium]